MKGTLYKIEEFIIPDIKDVEYPEEFEGVEIGMRTRFEEVINIMSKEIIPYIYPVFFYDEYISGGERKMKKMPVLGYRFLLLFKEYGIEKVFGIRLKKEEAIKTASSILEKVLINNIYEYEDVVKFKEGYKEIKEEKNEKEIKEKIMMIVEENTDKYVEEFKEEYKNWTKIAVDKNIKINGDELNVKRGLLMANYELVGNIVKKIKDALGFKINIV